MAQTILITGCSEGGLGDGLAQAFHKKGQRVIATARNPAKMAHFAALGIETLQLDVQSAESIAACVAAVETKLGPDVGLDMLINNSGGGYSMPLLDADIDTSRRVFDLNVWAVLSVIQAFFPLLLKAKKPVLVNNTSLASIMALPLSGIYNASKAAAAMLTETLRLELAPFGIRVVDLKTGAVSSNFFAHQEGGSDPVLPESSIYNIEKTAVENFLSGRQYTPVRQDRTVWADHVTSDLLASPPPTRVWRGKNASLVWLGQFLPSSILDREAMKYGAMDVVKRKWEEKKKLE